MHADRGAGARLPRPRRSRAEILKLAPPDVMNHNLETVPRLYKEARPGSDYAVQPEPAQEVQSGAPQRAHQERHDGRPGRDRRRDPAGDARHARAQHRHAHHRPVPGPERAPPAGAPLRAPRHVQDVRARGLQDGLQPCRGRRDGAQQLPRRPAGARRGRPTATRCKTTSLRSLTASSMR
jgi:hypothetical protein